MWGLIGRKDLTIKNIRRAFYALIIAFFIVSSLPLGVPMFSVPVGPFYFRSDHLIHMFIYFCITFMGVIVYSRAERKKAILFFIGIFVFAIIEEGHQMLVPGRDMSKGDLLFDFVGIGGAIIVHWILNRTNQLSWIVQEKSETKAS